MKKELKCKLYKVLNNENEVYDTWHLADWHAHSGINWQTKNCCIVMCHYWKTPYHKNDLSHLTIKKTFYLVQKINIPKYIKNWFTRIQVTVQKPTCQQYRLEDQPHRQCHTIIRRQFFEVVYKKSKIGFNRREVNFLSKY